VYGRRFKSFLAFNYKRVIKDCNMSQNVERKSAQHDGCSLRGKLRTFISFVSFVTLLPVGLGAQTASPTAAAQAQVAVYGNAEQTPLRYAGESAPANQLSLSVGVSTFYDDNVPQRNSIRVGDEAVSLTSQLALFRQTERLKLDLTYTPLGLLYRQVDQYNSLNHNAALNAVVRLSSRINLGLHEAFSYQNGLFQSLAGQPISSGLGSPTALNQTIFPYVTRTLSNTTGLDVTYVRSARTSLTFSGGFNRRQFGNQGAGQQLNNSWGVSGGLQYKYRVTGHTDLSLLLVHQDSTFRGGGVFGNSLRFQSESTFISIGSRLSPTVTLTIFGGPQYIRILGQPAAAAGVTGQFQGAGGGSITKEVQKTALTLSVQRTVTDGGGVYTLVKNTGSDFGVRRRLVGRWEATVHVGVARANTALFQLASGRTDALIGGVRLDRPLSGGATLHVSYDTAHETSSGALPYLADFDRNQVAIGIDYRFKAIPLGH
jgi:hypothetical protein